MAATNLHHALCSLVDGCLACACCLFVVVLSCRRWMSSEDNSPTIAHYVQSPNRPNRPIAQSPHHRHIVQSPNRPIVQSPNRPIAQSPNLDVVLAYFFTLRLKRSGRVAGGVGWACDPAACPARMRAHAGETKKISAPPARAAMLQAEWKATAAAGPLCSVSVADAASGPAIRSGCLG